MIFKKLSITLDSLFLLVAVLLLISSIAYGQWFSIVVNSIFTVIWGLLLYLDLEDRKNKNSIKN